MDKAFMYGSEISETCVLRENMARKESFVVDYFVQNAVELFTRKNDSRQMRAFRKNQRNKFADMIKELESIPQFSYGSKATQLWLRRYTGAQEYINGKDDEDTYYLPSQIRENILYLNNVDANSINFTRNQTTSELEIREFWFCITYANMNVLENLSELQLARRAIVDRWT
jgi:hypothetical protein